MEGNGSSDDKGRSLKKFRIKLSSIHKAVVANSGNNASFAQNDTPNVQTPTDYTTKTNIAQANDLKGQNEENETGSSQNIQLNSPFPLHALPVKTSTIKFPINVQQTNPLFQNSSHFNSKILYNTNTWFQSGQPGPINKLLSTESLDNSEFFRQLEEKKNDGLEGLNLSKGTRDSASEASESNASAAKSATPSSFTKAVNPGKFKLKIKKNLSTQTTLVSLKKVIEESYHYELPVGAVCITSGVYFDKQFFDAIYPGKKLSAEIFSLDRSTKSHIQLDRLFHKQRMNLFRIAQKHKMIKEIVDKGQSYYDTNRTEKISFHIKRHSEMSGFGKAGPSNGIGELFDVEDLNLSVAKFNICDATDTDAQMDTDFQINTDVQMDTGDKFDKNFHDFIISKGLFCGEGPQKLISSQINVKIPSCATTQYFSFRRLLARKLLKFGYQPVIDTTMLPGVSRNTKFMIDSIGMKLEFTNVQGKHLFCNVNSKISKEIVFDGTFVPCGTYRFITTSIKMVNLSSTMCDINIELAMWNKEIDASEPINMKFGIKKVQLYDQFKILPPSNYANLLFESFHRAIMMRKDTYFKHVSVQINQLLELTWDYMKSDNITLLPEIDSLAKIKFEKGQFPCCKIVIFTPKRCISN